MAGKGRKPTATECAAIDAIFTAYMACNSTYSDEAQRHGSPLAVSWSDAPGVMGAVREAGRLAWRSLGFTPREARWLWAAMCDGNSTAEWVYRVFSEEDGMRNYPGIVSNWS